MATMNLLTQDPDWTDNFIQTVSSMPALYDKSVKEYSDKVYVKRLWTQVCSIVIPNWDNLSNSDKIIKLKEAQLKWRNLRTCFKRELNKQEKYQKLAPLSAKRRRKYIYFDQLSFLLPHVENAERYISKNVEKETHIKEEPEDEIEEQEEEEEIDLDYEENSMDYPTEFVTTPSVKVQEQSKNIPQTSNNNDFCTNRINTQGNLGYEEKIINLLREIKGDEIDEDKSFLLSLVPTFKKLTDDQKIQAKMEILGVIQRVRNT